MQESQAQYYYSFTQQAASVLRNGPPSLYLPPLNRRPPSRRLRDERLDHKMRAAAWRRTPVVRPVERHTSAVGAHRELSGQVLVTWTRLLPLRSTPD